MRKHFFLHRVVTVLLLWMALAASAAGDGWRFSPENYRDQAFISVVPDTAYLCIHLHNYRASCGVSVVQLSHTNVFTDDEMIETVNLAADGRCTARIPMHHPGFVWIGFPHMSVFLIPGDTLQVVADLKVTEDESRFDAANVTFSSCGRQGDDAAKVNIHVKEAESLLGVPAEESWYEQRSSALAAGPEAVRMLGHKNMAAVCNVLHRKKTAKVLAGIEASGFVKDVLTAGAVNILMGRMEDMLWKYNQSAFVYKDNQFVGRNPDFRPLSYETFYRPLRHFMADIFDSPLAIMAHGGESFVNRTVFSVIFYGATPSEYNSETDFYAYCQEQPKRRQKLFGIGNCFASDLAYSHHLFYNLNEVDNTLAGELPPARRIDCVKEMTNKAMAYISSTLSRPIVAMEVQRFAATAARMKDGQHSEAYLLSGEEREVLDGIIAPFRSNLLYLDFWGIGCGPCRVAMIDQRKVVEQLKDEQMKFLYIASEKDSPRESSNYFLKENNIQGEHIYVRADQWAKLEQMFRFKGIPHGVLIAPDGTILQNGFHVDGDSLEMLRSLVKKYTQPSSLP